MEETHVIQFALSIFNDKRKIKIRKRSLLHLNTGCNTAFRIVEKKSRFLKF